MSTHELHLDTTCSHNSERGVSVLELAIVLPIILLLIGGMVDFGFKINAMRNASTASKIGARLGAAHSRLASLNIPCGPAQITSNCTGPLVDMPDDTTFGVTQVARDGACNFLRQSRNIDAENWDVVARIDEPVPGKFKTVTVTLRRNRNDCVLCYDEFFSMFETVNQSTFVLEGWCT